MTTSWVIFKNGDLALLLNHTKVSETQGCDGGCSTVIAQGSLDNKRELWDSVKKEYNLGEYHEG
jgi:hypothetical protein